MRLLMIQFILLTSSVPRYRDTSSWLYTSPVSPVYTPDEPGFILVQLVQLIVLETFFLFDNPDLFRSLLSERD